MANESIVSGYPGAGNRTPSARAQREEYWRRVLAKQRESGLTRAAFCRREGIKQSALSWWVYELRVRDPGHRRAAGRKARPKPKKHKPAAFLPVRVIQTAAATPSALEVVTREGHIIRLGPGFDPAMLRQAIAALEGRPC